MTSTPTEVDEGVDPTSTPTEVDEWVDQGVGHCFSTRLRKLQTRALPACFGIQDSKLLAAHQSVLSHTESDAALCVVKQNSMFVIAPRLEAVSSSETQPPRRRKKSSYLFGFVFFLHEVVVAMPTQCLMAVWHNSNVSAGLTFLSTQGRRHITQVASVTERTRHTSTAPGTGDVGVSGSPTLPT